MTPEDVPLDHPCPCGNGQADVRPTPTTEPNPKNTNQKVTTYHYRHDGCPIGGSAVLIGGELHRLIGPLFNPERYAVTSKQPQGSRSAVAADGGKAIEEGSK